MRVCSFFQKEPTKMRAKAKLEKMPFQILKPNACSKKMPQNISKKLDVLTVLFESFRVGLNMESSTSKQLATGPTFLQRSLKSLKIQKC